MLEVPRSRVLYGGKDTWLVQDLPPSHLDPKASGRSRAGGFHAYSHLALIIEYFYE